MNYKEFEKQAKEIGVGNRCIVSIEGREITDARLQKEGSRWCICQNARDGAYCADRLGYNYSWLVYGDNVHKVDYLKLYEVKYKEGDMLVDEDGAERMVLGVSGRVYHVSNIDYFEEYDDGFTIEELDESGYKLFQRDLVTFDNISTNKQDVEALTRAVEFIDDAIHDEGDLYRMSTTKQLELKKHIIVERHLAKREVLRVIEDAFCGEELLFGDFMKIKSQHFDPDDDEAIKEAKA